MQTQRAACKRPCTLWYVAAGRTVSCDISMTLLTRSSECNLCNAGAINSGAVPADRLHPAVSRAAAHLHPQALLKHSSTAVQSAVQAVAHKLRPKRSSSSSSSSSADSVINLSTDEWRHDVGREPQPPQAAAAAAADDDDSSSD
jgi:hypothetical protein